MKKIVIAIMLLALPVSGFCQFSEEGAKIAKKHLDELLNDSDDDRKIALYADYDVDGDEVNELVLASYDLKRTTVYSLKEDKKFLEPMPLTNEQVAKLQDRNNMHYTSVTYLLNALGLDEDDHLKVLDPMFIWDANLAGNRFTFDIGKDDAIGTRDDLLPLYTKMVFKPHVGDVKYLGVKECGKDYYDYSLIWKMVDPEFIKKEFRGYKSEEVAPILFKEGFDKTIHLLNFSRWKRGEPVKTVSKDVKDLILRYYRTEKIAGIRYVADCPENERSWYRVVFARKGNISHCALVCLAEGDVASVWDEFWDLNEFGADPNDLWYGGSLEEFWSWKQVEFMAMWGSPKGLEIAVRWPSLEGYHYSILREAGNKIVIASEEYQYFGAY